MKIIMFIVFFLLIGAFFIISTEGLHLMKSSEFNKFMGEYYSWIFKLGKNVGHITGYVVNFDWLP